MALADKEAVAWVSLALLVGNTILALYRAWRRSRREEDLADAEALRDRAHQDLLDQCHDRERALHRDLAHYEGLIEVLTAENQRLRAQLANDDDGDDVRVN